MECALCSTISEEHRVIEKNSEVALITNFEPMMKGHLMVLPTRHVQELSELTPNEAKAIFVMIQSASTMLTKTFGKDCLVFYNRGKLASQPHLHIHVLPMDEGLRFTMEKAYHIDPRKRISNEELVEIKKTILKKK